LRGTVDQVSLENLTLPAVQQNFTVNVNSTRALQLIRHATMNLGPASVENGTVSSEDLKLAPVYAVKGGAYPTIQPVNASTSAGQLRLLWIITTSVPNYLGYFVVDAETGQIVEAEGESVSPCGAPSGFVCLQEKGVYAAAIHGQTDGVQMESESFAVNGSLLKQNGTFLVEVPNVVVVGPGSSGSVGLNLTDMVAPCPSQAGSSVGGTDSGGKTTTVVITCIPDTTGAPSAGSLPAGVSASFTEPSVSSGGSIEDTMQISASSNASQGTYILLLQTRTRLMSDTSS
jgi:hypothetical protein